MALRASNAAHTAALGAQPARRPAGIRARLRPHHARAQTANDMTSTSTQSRARTHTTHVRAHTHSIVRARTLSHIGNCPRQLRGRAPLRARITPHMCMNTAQHKHPDVADATIRERMETVPVPIWPPHCFVLFCVCVCVFLSGSPAAFESPRRDASL